MQGIPKIHCIYCTPLHRIAFIAGIYFKTKSIQKCFTYQNGPEKPSHLACLVPCKNSSIPSRCPPVELQKTTETLMAFYFTSALRQGGDDVIVNALVRSFPMIMLNVVFDTIPQMFFTEYQHAVKTL